MSPLAVLARNTAGHRGSLFKTAVGAATFALGLHGFLAFYQPTTPLGVVDCLFRTVQLLFAQFPPEALLNSAKPLPLSLNIARFAMPALFLWIGASALVKRVRQPLRAAGVGWLSGHLILVGDSALNTPLLTAERAKKRKAVVITSGPATPAALAAGPLGAAVVTGDPAEPKTWRAAGVARARAALALGPDDATVAAATLAAADACRAARPRDEAPLELVALVEDADVRVLMDGAYRGRRAPTGVALQTRSSAEIHARTLLARHPLHRGVDVAAGARVRVLIVGFGAVGEQIALQVLRTGITGEAALPEVVVIDPDAPRLARAFRARHGDAPPLAQVRFVEGRLDPSDAPGLTALLAAAGEIGAVYLCLPDDTTALLAAVAIRRAQAGTGRLAPPLYARRHGAGDLGRQLAAAELRGVDLTRIHGFGGQDAAFLAALTGDALDRRAQAVHAYYLDQFPPAPGEPPRDAQRPWAALPEPYRQSSRDQADYLPMRLATLNLREVAGTAPVPSPPPDALEGAARAEHARWCASVGLIGWRHGPARDDAALLHPDLVPYDQLSERTRDKDRAVLRDMAGVLAREGRGLRPLRPVPLPPAGDGAVDRLLAAVDAVADAVPIVVSDLADEAAVAILHAAASRRPALLWRLENLGDLSERLARFSPERREQAVALINGAEQALG